MRQKQQRKKLQQIEKRGFQKPINTNIYNSYNQNINIENIIPSQNSYIPPQKQNNIILDRKQLLQKKLESQQYNPFGKGGSGATVKDQYGEIIAFRKPRTITNQNGQVYVPLNYSNIQNNNGMIRQQYVPSIIENRNYQMQQNNFQYQKNQYIQPQMKRLQNYQQSPHTQPIYQQRRQHQIQKPILYLPTNQYKQESNQLYKKGGRNLLKLENTDQVQLNLKQKQKMQMQRILKQQIQETQLRKKREQLELKMKQRQQQQKYNLYVLQEKKKIQEQENKKKQQAEKVRLQNQRNRQIKQEMEKQLKNKASKKNIQFNPPQIIERPPSENIVRQKIERSNINQKQNKVIQQQKTLQNQGQDFNYKSIQGAFNTQISRQFIKQQRERDPERRKKDKYLQQVKNQIYKIQEEFQSQKNMHKLEIDKIREQAQKAKYEKIKTEQQLNKIKQQLRKKINNDNQRLQIALSKNDPRQYQDLQTFNRDNFNKPNYQRSKTNNSLRQQQKNYKTPTFQVPRSRKIYQQQQQYQKIVPLKYQQNEKLIQKKYLINNNSNFDQGLESLTGQTLKIPVNLPNNQKLTMSRIQDYAVDSRYFHKKPIKNVVQKNQDIIYEQQQSQNYYKQADLVKQKPYKNEFQNYDQLDKLVDNHNKKNPNQNKKQDKWDNMSSVNSDITKQIQKIMKDQRPNNNYPPMRPPSSKIVKQQERPVSKLSNAGRNVINQKYGLAADGFTLKSEEPGTLKTIGTKNTFDIERINKNNDRRLEKLKELGIETLPQNHHQNHENDPELKKLDALLSNYQR